MRLPLLAMIVLASCLCGCGGHPNPAGPSAGSGGSSPTAVPTVQTQIIWQNGAPGCWGGNCATGSISVADSACGNLTTGSNTLEIYSTAAGTTVYANFLTFDMFTIAGTVNYQHLQFDIELGLPASDFSAMVVEGMGTCGGSAINPASLSQSAFTHVSLPNGSISCQSGSTKTVATFMFTTTAVPISGAYVYLNNVELTSN